MPDGYDPYQNPDFKPYVGSFTWVPTPRSGLGGDTPGPSYANLIIDRGGFRNDQVVEDNIGSVQASFAGAIESPEGSEAYPIIEAFRPLARPSLDRGFRPAQPFIAKGADLEWSAELADPAGSRLSATTLTYKLTVQPSDPELLRFLTEDDQVKVQAYLEDPENTPLPDIDFSQYPFGRISTVSSGGDEEDEFPEGDALTELQLTGFTGSQHDYRVVTVRFGDDTKDNVSDFVTRKSVRITNRYSLPTLRIELLKTMLFDAERVNLRKDQLPCALLQYAYEVKFGFEPSRGSALWPNDGIEPTFHLKLYCPDDRTNPRGFAHSVILRFLIFSMPAIGIAPGDNSSLAGLLDQITNPRAYFVSFIGPRPGRKSLRYTMLAKPFKSNAGYVVPLDAETIDSSTQTIILQKYTGDIVSTPPPDGAQFEDVYELTIDDGQQFSPSGPLVAPYLYLDSSGKNTDWYRIIQRLDNGAEFRSRSYRGSLYTEQNPLRMEVNPVFSRNEPVQTLVRRIVPLDSLGNADPLAGEPLAVFVANDEGPLNSPQVYGSGKWSVRFRAASSDKNNNTNNHVIVRVWLVPFNEPDTSTPERLQEFREAGELHFETATATGEKSRLVLGPPSDISQVMVSPPLTDELTEIEIIRYIETDGTSDNLTFSGGEGQKLVVGFYAVSVPAGPNIEFPSEQDRYSPTYSLEVNPDHCAIETTILVTQSHTLFPVQWYRYEASQYLPYTPEHPYGALEVGRELVGGGTIDSDDAPEYIEYDQRLASFNSEPVDAGGGLLALRQRDEPAEPKICIPISSVPNTDTKDVEVHVDFSTDGKTLATGRIANKRTTGEGVEPGIWRVEWVVNEDSDNEAISYHYRVEGLLFTTDGRIVERVFKSDFITHELGTTDYSFEYEVQIPFVVRGEDTQFALRFYAFPFSATGNDVDVSALQTQLGDKPVGVRLDKLAVRSHTIERLNIQQTDSFIGSPAFYENMPVVPDRSIGAEEFWYIAWEENLKFVIGFPGQEIAIRGSMYSPAWFTKLPRGMEVVVRAPALRIPVDEFARQLWVRTVPTEEEGEDVPDIESVSASQNPRSGMVHVGYADAPTEDPDGEDTFHVLRQSPSHSSPVETSEIMGQSNSKFGGAKGHLAHMPGEQAKTSGDWLTAVTQVDESEGPVFSAATSISEGQQYYRPNANLTDDDFSKQSRLAAGLQLPAMCPGVDGRAYAVGWAEPGSVIVRQCHLLQTTPTGEGANGYNYLVDGSADVEMPFDQTFFTPAGGANGRCVKSYPAVAPNPLGGVDVFYALEGFDGQLIARSVGRSTAPFGRAHIASTFRQGGVQAGSELAILHPSAAHDHALGVTYVAFWSSHRLFLSAYHPNGPAGTIPPEITLVAGSAKLDDETNPANPALDTLRRSGHLLVLRSDSEDPIPEQRCGVTIFQDGDRSSQAGVYYRNASGDLMCRYVTIGTGVTNAMKLI